ncbi:MAG: UDP-N-acetylglucosamine 2-epimerase (non-hydrolyzing) [Acidimicrobiia bacterium]
MQDHTINQPPGQIAVVLGTRPEIIKLAHVLRSLAERASLVHTGQHWDPGLSTTFLEEFHLSRPDLHLEVGGLSRAGQIASGIRGLAEMFEKSRPRAVVVQGDTNTTMAGAIAANALELPVVHVEAGLRSHDRRMPEEHNRVVTDHLADLLCAPTQVAVDNLVREGINSEKIVMTGNTVVEAVLDLMPDENDRKHLVESMSLESGGFVLSTFHRPENVDDPERFSLILRELGSLPFPVVLPLHPRSRARVESFGLADHLEEIRVVDPIGYSDFLGLGAESAFLVSDSGGVQEEVSVYKRPVVVVRRSTERPEVLGTFSRLVEPTDISQTVGDWLGDLAQVHADLSQIDSPYGDGTASQSIVAAISDLLESE